ncbi:hypothetical protein ACHAC9_16635 [Massilia sp. CMS3.1]|uniref:hypothetical protein n=1 Tax=Massilia sp. CMS3.1 TaxID=3373083 RepID=UPI003EE52C52
MENLDTVLAYKAMVRFLEKHYASTNADEIGALLGSMSMEIFQDDDPADPAMWEDWLQAIREANACLAHIGVGSKADAPERPQAARGRPHRTRLIYQ